MSDLVRTSNSHKMSSANSKFVITWVSNNNVYFKRYKTNSSSVPGSMYSFSSGLEIDTSPVLDNTLTSPIISDVAISNTASFVTTWEGTDGNIYIQMHDVNGNKI